MTDEDPAGRAGYPAEDDVSGWLAIATNPGVTPRDLGMCLEGRRPLAVRLAAVLNPAHPIMTAYAASGDEDPVIRAHAMLSPWLDEETRQRLMGDPAVMAAAARLTGDEDA